MSDKIKLGEHTKGPWRVGEDQGTSLGFEIVDKRDFPIAWTSPHRPQQDANARLIAAAPEMYEALRYALTCLEEIKKYEPNYHFYHYGAVSVDEQCRAALAKAEGRQ